MWPHFWHLVRHISTWEERRFWNWNFVYVIERKLISHEGTWRVGFHTRRKGNLKNVKSSCYPNSPQIWILSLIFSRGCTIWTVNHRCLALCARLSVVYWIALLDCFACVCLWTWLWVCAHAILFYFGRTGNCMVHYAFGHGLNFRKCLIPLFFGFP